MTEIKPWLEVLAKAGVELVPGGSSLIRVNEQLEARRAAAVNAYVADIASRTTTGNLAARLQGDPIVEAMFTDSVFVAVTTGVNAKRKTLAMVVSNAVLDDAKVDESALIIAALRELDAPHFRALERLRRVVDDIQARGLADGETIQRVAQEAWNAEPLPIRAALSRTGCSTLAAQPAGGLSMVNYLGVVSDFGRQLLQWVREADDDDQLNLAVMEAKEELS